MAKKSSIQTNQYRQRLVDRYHAKRTALKKQLKNRSLPLEERFNIQLSLSSLPRNSAPTRVRNRCLISGRPRGYYRKFGLSRIAFRDLASQGLIAGITKASW